MATFAPEPSLPRLASVCSEPDPDVAVRAVWLPPVQSSRVMSIERDRAAQHEVPLRQEAR